MQLRRAESCCRNRESGVLKSRSPHAGAARRGRSRSPSPPVQASGRLPSHLDPAFPKTVIDGWCTRGTTFFFKASPGVTPAAVVGPNKYGISTRNTTRSALCFLQGRERTSANDTAHDAAPHPRSATYLRYQSEGCGSIRALQGTHRSGVSGISI